MTPHPDDRLRIFLKDVVLPLSVGVHDSEHRAPQPVAIEIEAESAAHHRFDDPREKDLGKIVDYETIYRFIHQDLPRLGHIALLESVAEQIAAFCLRDPRIRAIRVRLTKTAIFPGATAAGIELTRRQPGGGEHG